MASNTTVKQFVAIFGAINVGIAVLGGVIGGAYKAEAKVEEVSERVVHQQWLTTLQEKTTTIATEAAEKAAERAVTKVLVEQVGPMKTDLAKSAEHDANQDQRIQRLEVRAGMWQARE